MSPVPTSKPAPKKATRPRIPAEERRQQVLEVAMGVVARDGMHAASTAEIAKGAGMSHAYLFRLFPTKEELMVEVARHTMRQMRRGMADAVKRGRELGVEPLSAMATEWMNIIAQRNVLQVSLQAISAAQSIPPVGEVLREYWELLVVDIEEASGETPDVIRGFIAEGMLLKIIGALGAMDAPWVERLHEGPLPCQPGAVLTPEIGELPMVAKARALREATGA